MEVREACEVARRVMTIQGFFVRNSFYSKQDGELLKDFE